MEGIGGVSDGPGRISAIGMRAPGGWRHTKDNGSLRTGTQESREGPKKQVTKPLTVVPYTQNREIGT